jgi:hypothetical protein
LIVRARERARDRGDREQQKIYHFEQQRMMQRRDKKKPSDCGWIVCLLFRRC